MENDARATINFGLRYIRALANRDLVWFTRVGNFLTAIELAGGTAVVAGALAQYTSLTVTAAIFVGLIPIINAVYDPKGNAARAQASMKAATVVLKKIDSADTGALQAELLDLQGEPSRTTFMDRIAYNDTCEQEGLEHGCYELSRVERLIRAMT